MLAAAPAAAAPFVDVTYDLGDSTAVSTIPPINVTTEVPPNGTISGTQTIRYAGGSGSATYAGAGPVPTLATGAAELLTFNLDVHATVTESQYTAGGGKTAYTINTADLHFEFLRLTDAAVAAGGVGHRNAAGTIIPTSGGLHASGIFRVTGTVHCYVACGVLQVPESTPLTVPPFEFTAPLPTLTGADGYPHTIRGTATGVEFIVLGIKVQGETRIVGREIDRTAVPEPGTLPLLAGGLAGLGLAAAAWRRRRGALRSARGAGLVLALPGGLLVALAAAPEPAQAASTVDVTYDLADSDLVWSSLRFKNFVVSNDDDSFLNTGEQQAPGLISGAMEVRYASDSSSGLPILSGPVTLQSFVLTAKSVLLGDPDAYLPEGLSATLRWQLTAPATGSLTPGGALAGLDVTLRMTGRANCLYTTAPPGATTGELCNFFFGVPTFTIYPSYTRSGPLELAGLAVPTGGIQSTRHTLTGRGRAIGWQPGAGAFGLGYDRCSDPDGHCGAHLVGREILRQADGHPDKVVPEPGTLLLLGAGTAGLALVSRHHRRSGMP